ncbi:MAG: hypothetical protein M0T73_16460 [Deltaproteobacteria bacterium]|nr:hypothetical protein [Deltaproteobacteria bacterium]
MARRRISTKTILFWFLAFVPLFIMLEVSSYILMKKTIPTRITARLGKRTLDFYVAQRKHVVVNQPQVLSKPIRSKEIGDNRAGLRMFHPELGWDYPPNIVYRDIDGITYHHGNGGERLSPDSYDKTLIATYGDSFTYCANVRDDCTWQTFLARRLGANVLNFGVEGYGSDQAMMKHELQGQTKARIVMLCILPENINRVVNIYRPFYTYNDPLQLTKPIFVKKGDRLVLMANPLKSVDDVKKLDDKKFLEKLAKHDYWYQLDRKLPIMGFPWTISLLHWANPVFEQIGISLPAVFHKLLTPHYPWNLFDEEYPFSVMRHLIDRFETNANALGSTPIIVIMPHKDFIQETVNYGMNRTARLASYLTNQKYPFLDVVQTMADMRLSRSQLEKLYQGHATAEGNQVLADILYSYLRKNFERLVAPKT